MTLWLLSFFPAFRALQSERDRLREALQSATTEQLLLQDRLDAAVEDRSKLWALTTECINGERTAYHMQINAQWQRQGFGAPYPDAPKLPSAAAPTPGGGSAGRPQVEMPSARVQRMTSDFISQVTSGWHPIE